MLQLVVYVVGVVPPIDLAAERVGDLPTPLRHRSVDHRPADTSGVWRSVWPTISERSEDLRNKPENAPNSKCSTFKEVSTKLKGWPYNNDMYLKNNAETTCEQ